MPSANSQISMRSHADRRSISIGVPLYIYVYLSLVSKLDYHADWSLRRTQTDWSEPSLSAHLVAMTLQWKGRLWSDCTDVEANLTRPLIHAESQQECCLRLDVCLYYLRFYAPGSCNRHGSVIFTHKKCWNIESRVDLDSTEVSEMTKDRADQWKGASWLKSNGPRCELTINQANHHN